MGKKKKKERKNKKKKEKNNIVKKYNLEGKSLLQIRRYIRELIKNCGFKELFNDRQLMREVMLMYSDELYFEKYIRKKLLDCMQKGLYDPKERKGI